MPVLLSNANIAELSTCTDVAKVGLLLLLVFGLIPIARCHGYAWSLLIWLVPNLALLWWCLSSPEYIIHQNLTPSRREHAKLFSVPLHELSDSVLLNLKSWELE